MRAKSPKELQKQLSDLITKLKTIQVEFHTKENKNVKEINSIKRDIARIHTINREIELQGAKK